jgi:hypothetical protein
VISERIKAALKVNQLAKEGKKLGNPNSLKALANAAKRRAACRSVDADAKWAAGKEILLDDSPKN